MTLHRWVPWQIFKYHLSISKCYLGANSNNGTLTSKVTAITTWHICPLHHGHARQYQGHECMTSIFFIPCQSMLSMTQPWPSVKVMERSFSTFFPDLCILCPKYLRISSKAFDIRGKSFCNGGCSGERTENIVTPDQGDWIICKLVTISFIISRACPKKEDSSQGFNKKWNEW